jgi:hypothetical protein
MAYNTSIDMQLENYLGYKAYTALLSQSGTAAPTAATQVSNFGDVTFTWARTLAGVYTVTASEAIFSANKTVVITSLLANALSALEVVVTSSTVITLKTTLSSVLLAVLSAIDTDGQLANTLCEIRVYN